VKSKMIRHVNDVADVAKVGIATGAPVLSIAGYPVEQWGYVLSAIVALFVIIEKSPVVIARVRQFRNWVRKKLDAR
jgi:hypothetical protein